MFGHIYNQLLKEVNLFGIIIFKMNQLKIILVIMIRCQRKREISFHLVRITAIKG